MRLAIAASAIAVALASSAFAQVLPGPSSDKPFTENWAPSKWGAQDRAGSANHTKNPANIQRALATVKQFKSMTVGKYYHRDIPSVGERKWSMVLPGTHTPDHSARMRWFITTSTSPRKSGKSAPSSTAPAISG